MTMISISGSHYSGRYNWRSPVSETPSEDAGLSSALDAMTQERDYSGEPVGFVPSHGSASLAAALWEIESSKAAKANDFLALNNPSVDEDKQQSYGSGIIPVEIVRSQLLQRKGLSEEDLAEMTPIERNSLLNEIDNAVQVMRLNAAKLREDNI